MGLKKFLKPDWKKILITILMGILILLIILVSGFVINTNGLIGYWRLEEGSSSPVDYSGEGNDGTLRGGLDCSGNIGRFGNACEFDGSDDYISMGSPTVLNMNIRDFAVEAWFKTSRKTFQSNSQLNIITKATHSMPWIYYNLFINSDGTKNQGNISIKVRNGAVMVTASSQTYYNDGEWHHTVGVREGDNLKLYVDGELVKTETGAGNINVDNNGNFVIGSNSLADSSYFDGIIDEVRIWNRALTPDEIKKLYELRLTLFYQLRFFKDPLFLFSTVSVLVICYYLFSCSIVWIYKKNKRSRKSYEEFN